MGHESDHGRLRDFWLATANSLARSSGPTGNWLTHDAGICCFATANSLARSSGHDGGIFLNPPIQPVFRIVAFCLKLSAEPSFSAC